VDTTLPTVTSVSSTAADGSYATGAFIPITVTFSEIVNVAGTPCITLETGNSDAVVNYTSGSGTDTLTFNYTVAAGNTTSDLNYVDTGSLALNGGTIKDLAGNSATLTLPALASPDSLAGNKNIVIDGVNPTVQLVSSTAANGTYGIGALIPITVKFSEAVSVTGTPQITLQTGGTDAVVNYTSGSGTDTLTFNYTVVLGQNS